MSDDFNEDDPFAEFEYWLVDGPAGSWPGSENRDLSPIQNRIVSDNATLLMNRDAWLTRMDRFEAKLASLLDAKVIETKRSQYELRFDRYRFQKRDKNFGFRHFPCSVSFHSTWFGIGPVHFDGAGFSGAVVRFDDAQFGELDLSVDGKWFGERNVSFSGTWFGKTYVSFHRTQFSNVDVEFVGARMERSALVFSDLQIQGKLRCIGLKVESAHFSSTQVDGLADWSGAEFGSIPDFRHMKLDRAPDVASMKVPEPKLARVLRGSNPNSGEEIERSYFFARATDGREVLKLRKLKAMAIAANDHEKDGEFFAYEMMAKRGVEHTTFWQLLFNTIYWKVSFYGQSYLRPLGWLSASFATFATIYSLMATPPLAGWNSLGFGITYSFKNSLPFLGTLTRSVPSPEGHVSWFAQQLETLEGAQVGPDWFTVLGTGQAMLSLFFFFFLLLGLRNKFRLK